MTRVNQSLQPWSGWAWASVMLALTGIAYPAQARFDPQDRFQLRASVDAQYDNNLFRLADEQPNSGFSRWDWVTTPQLQARYQNEFSRQQVILNGSFFAPRYDRNSQLDYQGHQWESRWNGRLGDLWHPGVGYRSSQSLASFSDVPLGVKDMIDDNTTSASLMLGGERRARISIEGHWGDKTHDSRRYLDLQDRMWAGVLGWRTTRGSDLGVRYEQREIQYEEPLRLGINRNYEQHKTGVLLSWPMSDQLMWKANLGYLQWAFDADVPGRSACIGGGELNWRASDKLSLTASGQRDADEPGDNLQISLSNRYRLEADWSWSDKMVTELSWSQQRKHYGVLLSQLARQDETNSVRAQWNWSPWQALTASLYWQSERRSSSAVDANYQDQVTGSMVELRY